MAAALLLVRLLTVCPEPLVVGASSDPRSDCAGLGPCSALPGNGSSLMGSPDEWVAELQHQHPHASRTRAVEAYLRQLAAVLSGFNAM